MAAYYTCEAIDELWRQYQEKGGEMLELMPGSLGCGTTVMYWRGLKTAVVQERYLSSWSSGHTVRLYSKMPRKYQDMIDKVLNAGD